MFTFEDSWIALSSLKSLEMFKCILNINLSKYFDRSKYKNSQIKTKKAICKLSNYL